MKELKELQIISKQMPSVTMNLEEVKADLTSLIEEYRGLVVTAETLKGCKVTQKELAKIKRKIDTYRKDIKRELLVPVKSFEDDCKMLIGMVEEVESPIKAGLLFFEDKRIEEKKKLIDDIVSSTMLEMDIPETYKQKIVIDKSFTNIGTKEKAIKDSIEIQCLDIKKDIERNERDWKTITDHLESTNAVFTLLTPLVITEIRMNKLPDGSHDVSGAISTITAMAKSRQLAENKAKEVTEENAKKVIEEIKAETVAQVDPMVIVREIAPIESPIEKATLFSVICDDKQKREIETFLTDNFISFKILGA